MSVDARESAVTLYTSAKDHYSHRVRFVLAEKSVIVDFKDVDSDEYKMDLDMVNPEGRAPFLMDHDLRLDESTVIMEYLDERYPHPPLMPLYPMQRAQCRLAMRAITAYWVQSFDTLVSGKGGVRRQESNFKKFRDLVITETGHLANLQYFAGNDFTLVDCCIAPMLWRLDSIGIDLPPRQTRDLRRYMDRVFARESFQLSLSDDERDMRTFRTS